MLSNLICQRTKNLYTGQGDEYALKICFVAHNSKDYKNGAALSLINVANELANRGIKVLVILPNKRVIYPLRHKNIKVIHSPIISMRTRLEDRSLKNKLKEIVKIIINIRSTKKLKRILKEENPDIIHINGLDSEVAAKAASQLDIPYLWHIRQLLDEDFSMRLHNEKEIYSYLKKANGVIGISEAVKEKFEPILQKEVKLIYNGIPLDEYIIKNKLSLYSNETINILIAGRIVEGKGQLQAVKAIKHLFDNDIKNIKLVIVGKVDSENYFNKLKSYIERFSLEEHITFYEHTDDLKELRRKCDIGLICSKKEAFGRVTIETMVSKMLVIGADTGGTKEIVTDHYNGLLYEEGNYIDLATKIQYAMENKREMESIIENAYFDALNKYSISKVVDQIIVLYEHCLKDVTDNLED